jgi:hypothetical protein
VRWRFQKSTVTFGEKIRTRTIFAVGTADVEDVPFPVQNIIVLAIVHIAQSIVVIKTLQHAGS